MLYALSSVQAERQDARAGRGRREEQNTAQSVKINLLAERVELTLGLDLLVIG